MDICQQFCDSRIEPSRKLGISLRLNRIFYARGEPWEASVRLRAESARLLKAPRQASESVIQFLFVFGQRFNRGNGTPHGFFQPGRTRIRHLRHICDYCSNHG